MRFNENRQFFTEGTELFNKTSNFYSRRVGAGEQLLNASKVTGRTSTGTGLGLLNALSQDGNGELTDFSVAVVDQNLPNNGFVAVQSGQVIREGDRRDDWVGSAAFEVRDSLQRWSLYGQGGVNRRSDLNSGEGEGHGWSLEFSRIKGRLQWTAGHYTETPEYDPNAIGFLSAPNAAVDYANIEYRIPQPFEVLGMGFNSMSWEFSTEREMLHTPRSFVSQQYDLEWRLFLASFDFVKFGATTMPYDGRDYFAPRLEGRFWQIPKWWSWDAFMSTDYRREFAMDVGTWNAGGRFVPRLERTQLQARTDLASQRPFSGQPRVQPPRQIQRAGMVGLGGLASKRRLLGRDEKPLGEEKQLLAHPRFKCLLCAGQPQGHHLPTPALLEPGRKRQLLLLG